MAGMDPLSLGLTGLGVLGNLYGYYQADRNQQQAQGRLDKLSSQPLERYGVNPVIQRYYQTATSQTANPMGYMPAERGAFLQDLNASQNAIRTNATNMTGGSLSKAINFIGSSGRLGALNQFASSDAQLRRAYLRDAYNRQFQGAGIYQNTDNMNTQVALSRRLMAEQALGEAVRSNRDYKMNLFSNIGQDLIGGGILSMGGAEEPEKPNNAPLYRGYHLNNRDRWHPREQWLKI